MVPLPADLTRSQHRQRCQRGQRGESHRRRPPSPLSGSHRTYHPPDQYDRQSTVGHGRSRSGLRPSSALGLERQPDVAVGPPRAAEDAPVVDEDDQAVLAPVQAPVPPLAAARTMPQRMSKLEEDVHEIHGALAIDKLQLT
ncbi:hypothetical protein Tco_1233384 [Tanacetum coccineum]